MLGGVASSEDAVSMTRSMMPSWKATKSISSRPSEKANVMPVISPKRECSFDNGNEASKETGGVLDSSEHVPNLKEWRLVPAATIRRFVEMARRGELLLCQGLESGLATKELLRHA